MDGAGFEPKSDCVKSLYLARYLPLGLKLALGKLKSHERT